MNTRDNDLFWRKWRSPLLFFLLPLNMSFSETLFVIHIILQKFWKFSSDVFRQLSYVFLSSLSYIPVPVIAFSCRLWHGSQGKHLGDRGLRHGTNRWRSAVYFPACTRTSAGGESGDKLYFVIRRLTSCCQTQGDWPVAVRLMVTMVTNNLSVLTRHLTSLWLLAEYDCMSWSLIFTY